nr:RNA-directed DNA polymerase, eukaryota [Tanacetum cinerariifolium]
MFFKVDFAKAYDSVRWDFLLDVLQAFGFEPNWCKWIRGTFSNAMASILVNGSPSSEFQFYSGLKQRDPLSPYLFILIMESLHFSFSRVVNEGIFKGISLNGKSSISHLFYADDAMFVGEWSEDNLKSTDRWCCDLSGDGEFRVKDIRNQACFEQRLLAIGSLIGGNEAAIDKRFD